MPLPAKVVLFRDSTHCYPCDEEGRVWHVWGAWGPLCEIQFPATGEPVPDQPELVFQDMPDFIGVGAAGYDMWADLRTREPWDHVPAEFEQLAFFARRFGLKMENPQHRAVAALLSDLVENKVIQGLPESKASELVQRWLTKMADALEG